MKGRDMSRLAALLLVAALVWRVAPALASDHADPQLGGDPNANISDLFAFPNNHGLVVVLDVHPGLTQSPPLPLSAIEFVLHFDFKPNLSFDNEEDRRRYGGSIRKPDAISADASLHLRLNEQAELSLQQVQGLHDAASIRIFSGLRDDPFIFPRFFGKNVVSMTLQIPWSAFPDQQRNFMLWAVTMKQGQQTDHVGRSNRTQLGRFDFLNPLPPSEHLPAIMQVMDQRAKVQAFLGRFNETQALAGLWQYVFSIRKYDLVPDVMIYSRDFPVGFPNGRRLEDDVAALTCSVGDCVLQEVSFIEGQWPRQTINDKPFMPDWPYLAEPWPDKPAGAPRISLFAWWPLYLGLLLLFAVALGYSWLIFRWGLRRGRQQAEH
ncbi:hypothetical protein [Pseudomarimonas arenosa]|uniref:DUF2330 domain-containing protein n=1 Tax=Pseudomarimonas arenosa TaxID=2774145 RepID=A0AAW3ZLA6_9GAMM|nr:hypothetical protein [Pseudomarimonas arenosa]MBD8525096.1 hypothetical protein [Pseudomarimonas arenosa]